MRHLKGFHQLFESQQELSQEQRDWLDQCTYAWEVNPQTGLVDTEGDFNCPNQGLSDFKGVRFGKVGGSFFCKDNNLTSLEGAPREVRGGFSCDGNRLTSLEGAPVEVGRDFSCHDNNLTSLEGAPRSVGESFYCQNNNLTSLKGAPQSVGSDFGCSSNSLTSLEGAPQKVGRTFYCENNSITSLEGAPQKVGGFLYFQGNPISEKTVRRVLHRMSDKEISLGQAVKVCWRFIPEEDKAYLAKHHPGLSPEDKMGYESLLKFRGKII